MKTQKANKKFNLEKFEVAKLKNLKGINGGQNGDDPITTDDNTVTDNLAQQSGIRCINGNGNGNG